MHAGRFIRFALMVVLAGGSSARCASAGIPDPSHDQVPCGIVVVGTRGSDADARGEFIVVHRDLANNPVAGADVAIEFGPCFDIRIATAQPFPGVFAVCTDQGSAVHATTDEHGIARFRIVGSANVAASGTPGAGAKCGKVLVDGVLVGYVNVAAFDLNGAAGVNPTDVALFLPDMFASPDAYIGRSDYNCDNKVNPADLAMLLGASLAGESASSALQYCH